MAKVLVVEDEMLIRELACEDLADAGPQVASAGSGDEALAILQADPSFGVLFTDIHMPGEIDGWELARLARELVPGIKAIFATGAHDPSPRGEGEECLRKPYTRQSMLDLVG